MHLEPRQLRFRGKLHHDDEKSEEARKNHISAPFDPEFYAGDVLVRVLENYGEFETSDGNLVMLQVNSTVK
ncbi:hypothetical protein ANCCEY_14893 [Ancylostoma ceylanicum]|uniref:Uncharacterized protein n=1 Tax=Ancylostoma ceylanicum TaxID=53326 RepID=A0A0D6L8Q9_9BILA|nr:hypothetical protein ANCCEY_14893 [Ancylostoma ceylanicum]